ncbi:MAG TPA: glycosyltransferase family 9 protein [Vicinamibacterales bacterium]|nr:glycosyltransferase family 9 protein [Vicinamibacterales bacterium]
MLRILLVRLRLIGDVALTTPLLRAITRRYPGARLTYLVEPAAVPVVRGNPNLSQIVVAPKRRGLARMRDDISIARRLRREHFDVAIDLHGGPRAAWFTWASGAPMRIGYAITGRAWMYTHVIGRTPDEAPRASVANQWDLLAPLDIGPPDPARDPLEMVEDPQAAASVDRRLQDARITGAPIVVVHVSAGNPFRRWPRESFEALVVALARRDPSRRIILTSGPSDASAAKAIADGARATLGPLAAAVPDIGEFDLAELRALVGRAAVYIGGDSGPLHIAGTTTTPIVALLGPTLPERSMPWRDARWFAEAVDAGPLECRPCRQRECAPGDFRCLTRITADQVAAAAERALEHSGVVTERL